MGKSKKNADAMEVETPTKESVDEVSYEEKAAAVTPISHPLASKKLAKKLLKVVKKASKDKAVKRGVKEVVKGLRKGATGFVIIAGDISPIDVISHVPILCEEANVPYIYVPSKEDLGSAGSTKRPTSCVMIVSAKKGAEYQSAYDEVMPELKELNSKIITTV